MKNELRIGNVIKDVHDRILTVVELRANGIRCVYEGQTSTDKEGEKMSLFDYQDCTPIELTPEILERIEGIAVNIDEDYIWHELRLTNGIVIVEGDKNGFCEMVVNVEGKELRCRHLHVLQNWVYYFSQGQQELTIKL